MPTKTTAKKKPPPRSAPARAPQPARSRTSLPKTAPKAAPSKVAPKEKPAKVLKGTAPPAPALSKKAMAASTAKGSKKDSVRPPLNAKQQQREGKATVSRPPPEAPKPLTLEERVIRLESRLQKADSHFLQRYKENLDMSWIHHDSALEGVVYTLQELKAAIDPQASLEVDSSLQPICEEIRRHREALEFVRDYAAKPKQSLTVDTIKQIYLLLHPEEGDLKTVKYRKDIPQHRLYFHEYAAPDKIAFKVRQVIDWIHDPETKKSRNMMRIATRAHYDLLRVFPFATDSGKVARLFMNLMLLRAGLPPAIVHSTERQRYYDALKGSSAAMNQIVAESIENNLASIEKLIESYEAQRSASR